MSPGAILYARSAPSSAQLGSVQREGRDRCTPGPALAGWGGAVRFCGITPFGLDSRYDGSHHGLVSLLVEVIHVFQRRSMRSDNLLLEEYLGAYPVEKSCYRISKIKFNPSVSKVRTEKHVNKVLRF